MSHWPEFLAVAGAHAVAVASPGPDFALVLRQSLVHGRRTAIWTSLGIGTGISLHVAYSLLGIGFLIRSSATAFTLLRYAGAAYLAWIGFSALTARPRDPAGIGGAGEAVGGGRHSAFAAGFLTNALNPKATLFFLALFPLAVSPTTPKMVQAGYGIWIIGYTAAWFCFVSTVFTNRLIRDRFMRHGHWIDRAMGVVFLGFAAGLVFTALA